MAEANQPTVLQVPSFYVDAVQLIRQPFTVQVLLGSLDMTGQVSPSVHLTINPEFCRQLGELLLAAAAPPSTDGAKDG